MTKDIILEGLKEVFATVKPKLDLSKVGMESNLVRDLGMDSLSMLLMSLATEQRFSIRFDNNVWFEKVGDVVDYIFNAVNLGQ